MVAKRKKSSSKHWTSAFIWFSRSPSSLLSLHTAGRQASRQADRLFPCIRMRVISLFFQILKLFSTLKKVITRLVSLLTLSLACLPARLSWVPAIFERPQPDRQTYFSPSSRVLRDDGDIFVLSFFVNFVTSRVSVTCRCHLWQLELTRDSALLIE